jgi:predicted ATPase
VDIAVELLPKVAKEAEFRKWCDRCRYAAREQGSASGRVRTLSLRGIHDLAEMLDVRYRILRGDPKRVAVLIPAGQSS